jgi:alpha-tubulin suppressor-like RCC1 family protein
VTTFPEPFVHNYDFIIFDDVAIDPENNNGDGIIDHGETIHVALLMRNHWGRAKDLKVTIDNINGALFNDPFSEVLVSTQNYGDVSSFSTVDNGLIYNEEGVLVGVENPFVIKIKDNAPNDYGIHFRVFYETKNGLDETDETVYTQGNRRLSFFMIIRNGIELPSIINEDMTLTNENYYIIPNAVRIAEGVTVKVEEGTNIQFWSAKPESPYAEKPIAQLQVDGKLIIEGSPDHPVEIFPSEIYWAHEVKIFPRNNGEIYMNYVNIVNPRVTATHIKHAYFRNNLAMLLRRVFRDGDVYDEQTEPHVYAQTIDNSIFWRLTGYYDMRTNYHPYRLDIKGFVTNSLFDSNHLRLNFQGENNVFLGNFFRDMGYYDDYQLATSGFNMNKTGVGSFEVEKVFNNNFDSVYAIIQWSENSIDRFLDMTGATLATIDSEEENEFIRKHIESTQLNNILFGLAYNQALNQFVDYEGVVSTYLNLGEPIDAYQHNFSSNPLLRIGLDGKFYPSHEINNNLKHYLIEFNDFFEYEALVSLMDLNGEDITVLGFDDQTYPINDILENTSFTYDQVDIIFETPNVIEVKNDQLEILNEGITKVTIVSKDRSYIKSFVIKVISSLTDDLVLADSALIETSDFMLIGKTYRFDFDLSPVNSNETVYLVSSDEAILKIVQAPNNMIIPLSKGVVKVMLMSESGKVLGEKTIDVDYDVTSIRLNKDIYYVSLNSQEVLSYTLSHDALFNDVQWISSDETIAYVDDSNQLIILKEGTIKIAVKHLTSGQMDEAIVTVNNDFTENDVFIDIQATSREMFALTSQGTVWRWGGGIDSRTATVLPLENILFMSTSYNAALFVDKDGNAFYYNGNIESITSIKNVISASLFDVGGGHMSLIREDGSIWAKGDNSYNQLGNNSSTRYDDFIEIIGIDNPVKTISTRWTNYFLNEAGNLYYLGFPTNTTTPIKVGIDEKIVDIKHYQNQNCWEGAVIIAEDINGDFYKVQANSWSKVESQLDIKQYINVGSCGGASDFILTDDGDVYAKGPNFDGNLGLGSSTYVGDYQKVEIDNITKISASQTNTMAINDLGQIFVWGNNDFYQVGDMTYVDSLVPFMVPIGLILDERPVEIESVTFEKNNDLMLTNSSIIIDFNKSVQISQNYFNIRLMDENNVYVSLNRTLLLDKIVLTPTRPLNPSKTYKLDIPENAVIDLFTQANIAMQMDITTHSVLDIYSESFEIDSTLYAYLNKYVDHYLNLMFDIYQIDGYFSTFTNNAILNHLHSTDMDGWLRFYGEESDDIIPLTRNYYGTTSSFIANLHAIDFNNFQILSDFVIDPILSKPNESMYPFVYDVKYFDESNQETTVLSTGLMTFKLYFNRDMDTTIQPLVFFGPEYPYTDYVVSGDWVDERTWVGQYNITPLTGDGLNYMRIRDAYAKDNAWLRTGDDDGRFTFDIATFGVESINLSSESLDGGVKLNWSQDEYETMMGYNIYRSEKVDGIFERVNFTVIPYTDNTFIDRTVEPGKVYFYKYSIVKTDLSEANFSDIIPGASIDTILPSVSHNRIYEVELGQNVIISLNATDNIQVIGATLFYKNANDATFKSLDMLKGTNDRYFQTIRASEIDVLGLEYYFEVYDGVNTYSYGSASASNFVVVKESITNPITSGDINNDGILNILDVLMMLQAINNIITLDSEAFERADLNQDDILSAFEALALLQFITGTRNTLVD